MNEKDLLQSLAQRFAALGANESEALFYLQREASRRLLRIVDKYSRYIPVDQRVDGFEIQSVRVEGGAFVADIALSSGGAVVKAAKVTFDPTN